jgi:hypothetical protein
MRQQRGRIDTFRVDETGFHYLAVVEPQRGCRLELGPVLKALRDWGRKHTSPA